MKVVDKLVINGNDISYKKSLVNGKQLESIVISGEQYVYPDYFLSFNYYAETEEGTVTGLGESIRTDLVIPSKVYQGDSLYEITSINNDSFRECSSLTSIKIPDHITSIRSNAFYGCSNLTSITIGKNVQSLGSHALTCYNLTEIYYNATNCPDFTSYNYALMDAGKNGAGITVTIGANVERIPARLFHPSDNNQDMSPKITAVIFEEGSVCKRIGSWAFDWCKNLTSIEIPGSVEYIGQAAFGGCAGLTSLVLGKGVEFIDRSAFSGCSSLTSVEIPGSVTLIDDYAFYDCSSLTSVVLENGIPGIRSNVFQNCNSLTSIEIPDSVTSIGEYAFENCSSLTSIEIPDSVTSIGDCAFRGCSGLLSFIIPAQITRIKEWTFYECTALKSVIIPSSVTLIEDYAFYDCSSLRTITFAGTMEEWNRVKKVNRWRDGVPATKVVCSDGEEDL